MSSNDIEHYRKRANDERARETERQAVIAREKAAKMGQTTMAGMGQMKSETERAVALSKMFTPAEIAESTRMPWCRSSSRGT